MGLINLSFGRTSRFPDHNLLILKNFYQSVAQPGRALRLGRRCCWFKSSHFDFFMQGYTVGVAGQTVNLLSLDSGSATLSPCTSLRGFKSGSRTDCLGCRSKRTCENHVAPPYLYLVVVMVTAD